MGSDSGQVIQPVGGLTMPDEYVCGYRWKVTQVHRACRDCRKVTRIRVRLKGKFVPLCPECFSPKIHMKIIMQR